MKTSAKTTGLRYWMLRVLDECDHVAVDFSADPVHDLRVALRRCRSMADGLMAMDPDPEWKAMKKAGKQLFQSLGNLRDVQIMMEWTGKLYPASALVSSGDRSNLPTAGLSSLTPFQPDHAENAALAASEISSLDDGRDPVAQALLNVLAAREGEHKQEAEAALKGFDRKQWRHWSKSLPARAARFRTGSALFKHLALERWTEAHALHSRALRNRSQVALHQLRIGIKRFRYIVENFLPEQHKLWSDDLKHVQDLLGEVHDLDVLWSTALSCHVFPDDASRKRWHAIIIRERQKRVEEYREKMTGPQNLWQVWRSALPQGKQIKAIATRRVKLWAKALDPDFGHSQRIAHLSVELYDGLRTAGLLKSVDGPDARSSLEIAALLHDVGKAKKKEGHQKASMKLIQAHGAPLGWNPEDMRRAATVARFHCGALPRKSDKALRDLLPNEQRMTIELAAILRLANAFDATHDGRIRRVRVENCEPRSALQAARNGEWRINEIPRKAEPLPPGDPLVIAAEGYTANSPAAQTIAAERHLLEMVLRRPVMVRPMIIRTAKPAKVRPAKNRQLYRPSRASL